MPTFSSQPIRGVPSEPGLVSTYGNYIAKQVKLTDRVPDAYDFDWDIQDSHPPLWYQLVGAHKLHMYASSHPGEFFRISRIERARLVSEWYIGVLRLIVKIVSVPDIVVYLGKKGHSLLGQHADFTNQPRDGTSGESPTAEAKEEEFIALLVVGSYKVVSFADIFCKA